MTVLPETLAPHAAAVYAGLAGVVRDVDPENGYAAAWLIDGITNPVEDARAVASDPESAFDPSRCPDSLVPWLACLVGINPQGQRISDLRRQIPAPEGYARGRLTTIQSAAQRTLVPGASVLVTQDKDPATWPTPAAFNLEVLVAPADIIDAAATARAIAPHIPPWEKLHLTIGAGSSIDGLTGTINAQTGSIDAL
jgi:hypothetical protein